MAIYKEELVSATATNKDAAAIFQNKKAAANMICRQRKITGNTISPIQSFVVPETFKRTLDGEAFLFYDVSVTTPVHQIATVQENDAQIEDERQHVCFFYMSTKAKNSTHFFKCNFKLIYYVF